MAAQSSSINLLTAEIKPQGQWDRIYTWTISTAKYIIIITELMVLGAIGYRFVLDSKIAVLDEDIESQNSIMTQRKPEEERIKNLISSVDSIKSMEDSRYSLSSYYIQIQPLIPVGISVSSFSIDIQGCSISGTAANNDVLLQLERNLKSQENLLSQVRMSLNQSAGGATNFTVNFLLNIKTE